MKEVNRIYQGDALTILKTFPPESVEMVITSPPYWGLRDYGIKGQIGLEPTYDEYLQKLIIVFDEVKRVLKNQGTCWINLGDTYSGSNNGANDYTTTNRNKPNTYKKIYKGQKPGKTNLPDKSLCVIPFRFAILMVQRGWILRNDIIWQKPNAMPSSVEDRFTVDYEHLFFFVKSKKYYFKQQFEDAVNPSDNIYRRELRKKRNYNLKTPYKNNFPSPKYENKRNKRCVWRIPTKPFPEAHFAVYPVELCRVPIESGSPENGIVLDPFTGSGTTAVAAKELGRKYIGIELNPEYVAIAEKRLGQQTLFQQTKKGGDVL